MEDNNCHCSHRMHSVLKVTKIILQAAAVAAGFTIANEIRHLHHLHPHPLH